LIRGIHHDHACWFIISLTTVSNCWLLYSCYNVSYDVRMVVGISHRGWCGSRMSRPVGDVLRIRSLDWICLLHLLSLGEYTLMCVA
jgi:hypothetical protein